MKSGILLTAAFLVLAVSLASAAEPVKFADVNLKAIVEKTLGSSDPTADDMLKLTKLYAGSQEIGDLGGLEHAKNLTSLCIHRNKVKDISAVANLSELSYLCVHDNQVEDISAVAGLKNLTNLLLYGNKIESLSPIANLSSLASLYANNNRIENISAVAGLRCLGGCGPDGISGPENTQQQDQRPQRRRQAWQTQEPLGIRQSGCAALGIAVR